MNKRSIDSNEFERQEDIFSTLIQRMKQIPIGSRLPAEDVLAEQLGISRMKLRDVLTVLETYGYISRQKGVGTCINHYLLGENARLDIDVSFSDVITSSGYKAELAIKRIRAVKAETVELNRWLGYAPSEVIYQVEKTIYADGVPAIYLLDYIPSEFYEKDDVDIALLCAHTFRFVQKQLGDFMENAVAHPKACLADETVAAALDIEPGAPVLRVDLVCYTRNAKPVIGSTEYLLTDKIPYCFQKHLNPSRTFFSAVKNK